MASGTSQLTVTEDQRKLLARALDVYLNTPLLPPWVDGVDIECIARPDAAQAVLLRTEIIWGER